MARVIKFRVWDQLLQEYFSWEDSVKYNNYHNLMEDGFDACVLEQFTGFRDENGTDVYEGDIIRGADEGFIIGVVEMGPIGQWECGGNLLYDCLDGDVIGNRHVNEELLDLIEDN